MAHAHYTTEHSTFTLMTPILRPLFTLVCIGLFTSPLFAASPTTSREPIRPLPAPPKIDPKIIELGKALFHDPRLSGDDTLSCASCHSLSNAGMDGLKRSTGIRGQKGPINAPTVYNSSLHFSQFWDGRAATLEEQAAGPVENPLEMGAAWPDVIKKLKKDPHYVAAFDDLYQGELSKKTVTSAIADFERTLITTNNPFDRYLKGDLDAISEQAQSGYQLFKAYGCSSCHQGAAVGGNMYQTMGVARDYFQDRGYITKADFGRFNVNGDPSSKFEFKVPSLRNIELTAPYFHDGSAKTLKDAVNVMGKYQIGREIPPKDLEAIIAFLKTLTGLPRSTP